MNVVHLVLLQFIVFGLLGVPLAHLADPEGIGYLASYTERAGIDTVLRAYLWTVYAAVVLTLLFYMTGTRRRLVAYQERPETALSRRAYGQIWMYAFTAGLACATFLYVQNGFEHPGLKGFGMDYLDYALLRVQTSETINMNVYNVGLTLFVSFAMIVALFYLKSFWRVIITAALFITLGSFSLAKAPMASAVLLWLFYYIAVKKPALTKIGVSAICLLAVLSLMYFISGFAGQGQALGTQILTRVLSGQFADLPYYFECFETSKVPLTALLPPYMQCWLGLEKIPSAARLVMEYTNPAAVAAGTAGVASTIFIGEAYAWAGLWGIVFAPFWVAFHFWLVTAIFTRLPKNIWCAFVFAYLFYRMSMALIGGFSYFVFSGIHIVLLAVAGALVARDMLRVKRVHGVGDALERGIGESW